MLFERFSNLTEKSDNEALQSIRDRALHCNGCNYIQLADVVDGKGLLKSLETCIASIKKERDCFVCLDCVKSDGKTREANECKVEHSWRLDCW